MYNTIVVPVDLAHKDRAATMIETAKRLADGDAKIVLTNVIEEFPAYVVSELPGQYVESAKDHAVNEMKRIAESTGFNVEIDVRVGHPAKAILSVAESNKADAIVIASHQPGLQDYLLGSTAARVVRHAHCTVVVVR